MAQATIKDKKTLHLPDGLSKRTYKQGCSDTRGPGFERKYMTALK
ncbi:hypothetical protein F441_02535 [Phytophthora nicotianae CJ01A1]|uniref:Uncharacterized protein n=5 Tax=Phytophthora nicotianae TaxID=4792 RepID=W2QRW6_PHYN3|nr:hypothetical protein PPTG_22099 [Phytophthora nicotianae INRA-310]ETK94485.1 hypothetical protein L915_02464 [Phytophthora nicotianae]ETO83370.1 hypothetical protein F444_02581 [Phytophthora nicotianae P1976]ETP24454.1 hypothetical protein F441_02535 [Phytophthora nicotianae CJ01A1]ETP52431.1 hypothetical protein F442_02560 [Phytophthora nicotianae P10297]ETL47859.1 hypothetical protein L916_02437 [Phytophthora nicotianae]